MNHLHIQVLFHCASNSRSMFGGSIRRRVVYKQRISGEKAYLVSVVYLLLNNTGTNPAPLHHKYKYKEMAIKPAQINITAKPTTITIHQLRKEVRHA